MNNNKDIIKDLLNVLVVEDDEDHANIIYRIMSKSQFSNIVDRVKDGEEATAYLRQEGVFKEKKLPDLILLDLKMPKKNGHELLHEIKNNNKLKNIPVVIMSTSDSLSDKQKAYENYCNSYVVKPLDSGSFQKLVEELQIYWGEFNQKIHL